MKAYRYTITALIIMLLFSASVFAELKKGEKLHPFSLKSIDDKVVTVKIDEGKLTVISEFTKDGEKVVQKINPDVILLDFWATWCPPCRVATPHLQKLYKEYKPKKGQDKGGLLMIGVSLDHNGSKAVKPFVKKQKLTYIMLADSTDKSGDDDKLLRTARDAAGKYKVQGIPTAYLFDAKGVIKDVHVGFREGLEVQLEDEIKKLIAERKDQKE